MKNIAYINPTPNLNFPHNRLKQFKKKRKKKKKKPKQGFKCSTGIEVVWKCHYANKW